VQASTSSGDINSDFAGGNIAKKDSGGTAQGRTGNGPQFAQVTIQTSSGDISVNQG
jgi:hypothetical protein